MHHHSYFSVFQKSTIGIFISVSGTHETKRQHHLSQSTDTVHSAELYSARQSLLHAYISSKRTGSSESVIQVILCIHPSISAIQSSERGAHYAEITMNGHTHMNLGTGSEMH